MKRENCGEVSLVIYSCNVFAAMGFLAVALAFVLPVEVVAAPEAGEESIASEDVRLKNWPNLLGPSASVASSTGLLMKWDGETGEGIKWKTRIRNC